MPNIKASEMRAIDRVLGMESGYVLDFSDRTIAEFFLDELNIDFNDPRFAVNGTSKAKRLRTFLQTVDKLTAARTLRELLKYRGAIYRASGRKEDVPNADGVLLEVIGGLEGKVPDQHDRGVAPPPASAPVPVELLKSELIALHDLAPQPRGYAFETFLIRGSPPFSRTLTRRPIEAMRSVHVKASQVQCRVQAWRGGASQSARCQLRPGGP